MMKTRILVLLHTETTTRFLCFMMNLNLTKGIMSKDTIVPLSVIMSQHTLHGGCSEGSDIESFLESIPNSILLKLHSLIKTDKKREAVQMACEYVVRYFSYISLDMCLSHGEFVHILLNKAFKS